MREIKFRGKRKDNGEWVYGHFFVEAVDNEDRQGFDNLSYIKTPYGDHYQDHEVYPETVGQYTGLRDGRGREIYEGDILEHYVDFGPAGERPGYKTAVSITPYGLNIGMWVFTEEGYLPEIIGNIHEAAPCSK